MVRPGFLQRILKKFFHLLYHQFAWTYDLVAWLVSLGQWKDWVASVTPYISGDQILEIGHGPGHLQKLMWQKNRQPFGIDLSPQMGRICKKRILKSGFHPKLVNASGEAVPFKTGTFSSVVATFPSEYIVQTSTLTEIHRILKPGGKFILLPMAWITGTNPAYKFAAWLFKITGQSIDLEHPSLKLGLSRITDTGFLLETNIIEYKFSKLIILEAKK